MYTADASSLSCWLGYDIGGGHGFCKHGGVPGARPSIVTCDRVTGNNDPLVILILADGSQFRTTAFALLGKPNDKSTTISLTPEALLLAVHPNAVIHLLRSYVPQLKDLVTYAFVYSTNDKKCDDSMIPLSKAGPYVNLVDALRVIEMHGTAEQDWEVVLKWRYYMQPTIDIMCTKALDIWPLLNNIQLEYFLGMIHEPIYEPDDSYDAVTPSTEYELII